MVELAKMGPLEELRSLCTTGKQPWEDLIHRQWKERDVGEEEILEINLPSVWGSRKSGQLVREGGWVSRSS